ncbi:MAG: hypothetical protein WA435_02265 [Gallionellaceae bacterium]
MVVKRPADQAQEVQREYQGLQADKPSAEALEEVEYLLQRIETFVAKWRPSPKPTPGFFYVPPQWATSTDREAQEALRLVQEIRSMGLGARWGAKRYLAPVMVAGLIPSALKAPLSAIHAVAGASEGDIHQLIETLSERLNIESEKPAAYAKALKEFVTACKAP